MCENLSVLLGQFYFIIDHSHQKMYERFVTGTNSTAILDQFIEE
jgi:hypothetical protein